MRPQLKHTILISIALLMMLLPSLGRTAPQKTWIQKNQLTPFEGVLLDENAFRSISNHLYIKEDLETELQNLKQENLELKSEQDYGTAWFVAGFLLGGVVTYSVVK